MTIAVDYDGTITADKPTFKRLICLLVDAGHTVLICTGRNACEGNRRDVESFNAGLITVVYAGERTKREACRAAGFNVDVWIDDCPAMIDGNVPILGAKRE